MYAASFVFRLMIISSFQPIGGLSVARPFSRTTFSSTSPSLVFQFVQYTLSFSVVDSGSSVWLFTCLGFSLSLCLCSCVDFKRRYR